MALTSVGVDIATLVGCTEWGEEAFVAFVFREPKEAASWRDDTAGLLQITGGAVDSAVDGVVAIIGGIIPGAIM